jgi:hypothetical protein
MLVRKEHQGTCVAFNDSPDAPVVRILSVYREGYNPSISYESSDGHPEIIIESMFRNLDDSTRDWRLATEEETAQFLARYTPPPQNWF